MKVLFVCYANVGRSQTAKALYNYLTGTNDADSAGTGVDENMPELNTLGQFEKAVSRDVTTSILREKYNINAVSSPRMQITPGMLKKHDLVVNIAEKSQAPDWLHGENVIWWDIADPGLATDIVEKMKISLPLIEEKVKKLIEIKKAGGDFGEINDNINEANI